MISSVTNFYYNTTDTEALGCSCRDFISKSLPATIQFPSGKSKKYVKCKALIKNFPIKCRQYGGEKNVCCKSCMGVGECVYTFEDTDNVD